MQKGLFKVTFMQEGLDSGSESNLAEEIHAVVDRMLAPFGKVSPRGTGLLSYGSPPIDITKPNQHDSKAEFTRETQSVASSIEHLSGLIRALADTDNDSEHSEMLKRLRPIIDQKMLAQVPHGRIESPFELVRKNIADVGGFTSSIFVLLDLWTVLNERQSELRDQEDQFWTVSHRPPDYYARAVALRLAKLYTRETGQRPTVGTSGETGDPSTGYTRALTEVFSLLGISTRARSPAEWAVEQITDLDMNPPVNYLRDFMGMPDPIPASSDSIRKIANALSKRSEE